MHQLFAGIDLGGTAIKISLANEAGDLLAQEAPPTDAHEGPLAVIERIGRTVDAMIGKLGASAGSLAGVGMGVPGLVDVATGTTKFLPNLTTHWRDVPVAEILGRRWDCPVRLLNDVRIATLGELRFGHGSNRPGVTMIFLALGTGVGGGIVLDGRLRLGPLGAAGELGHQTMLPDGPRCGCGSRGCLETLASGPAIAAEGTRLMRIGLAPKLHQLVNGCGDDVTSKTMSLAAREDPAILEAIVDASTYVGIAVANVITTLHPEIVVLGGGVAQLGDILINTVRRVVADRVRMFPTDPIQIVGSQLGERAGVMGAIALAHGPIETI